jgi:DHA2 family lincomycin resistance protein-like MFS transporter
MRTVPLRLWATIGVLSLTSFTMNLNETALSVAVPSLMRDFGVGAGTAQWLTTGFMVTVAVVVPVTSYLMKRFTLRALWCTAVIVFVTGAVTAGCSASFAVLMLARLLQATGTAAVMPLMMAVTIREVPPGRRGMVLGVNGVALAAAPALGPTVAGLVLAAWGWRWVFGVSATAAGILFLVGISVLPRGGGTRRIPCDALSVVLSAVAFGGVVYALTAVPRLFHGEWLPFLGAGLAGTVCLRLFVRRQRILGAEGRVPPLLDLRPLSVTKYRRALLASCLPFGVMTGQMLVLSILLQDGLGMAADHAGLVMLPIGVSQMILAPVYGWLLDNVGYRPVAVPATVVVTLASIGFATVGQGTPVVLVIGWATAFGIGIGGILTTLLASGLSALPTALSADGTSLASTAQQVSGGAGTALLTTVLTMTAEQFAGGTGAVVTGAHLAFVVAALVGVVSTVLCLRIPRDMKRPGTVPVSLTPVTRGSG